MFGRFFIKKLSDTELIDKFRKTNDNACIGELFERYTQFMFCVCIKYFHNEEKSKDAVMQIVEKLINELHKHEISNFKPWLHTVVKNYCLMQIRSEKNFVKKQELHEKDAVIFMETDHILNHDSDFDIDAQEACLSDAISELNPEQKICIELFYLQDKSYTEIVENTGYSMNQVKSYIQNGKRNLKIIITEMYERNK